jgi:hypothetical protein
MAASVNAALKPLETLSKIVNQPSRHGGEQQTVTKLTLNSRSVKTVRLFFPVLASDFYNDVCIYEICKHVTVAFNPNVLFLVADCP